MGIMTNIMIHHFLSITGFNTGLDMKLLDLDNDSFFKRDYDESIIINDIKKYNNRRYKIYKSNWINL